MRRKRAILTPKYIDDMHRYLGRPETHETPKGGVWVKPYNVNNVWMDQALGRFRSFGVMVIKGWWNPETHAFETESKTK